MKKYIRSAIVRKQMKKPVSALKNIKNIEIDEYDRKRKELDEKKYQILSSLNSRQK